MSTYPLGLGASIALETDDLGMRSVTVTIPPGSSGEGSYTSSGPGVGESAKLGILHASDPAAAISIRVTGSTLNAIVVIFTF